jgi:hypothetical protein
MRVDVVFASLGSNRPSEQRIKKVNFLVNSRTSPNQNLNLIIFRVLHLPSRWSRTHVSKGLSQEPGARQSPEVEETSVLLVVEVGMANHAGCACSCVTRVSERLHLCIILQPGDQWAVNFVCRARSFGSSNIYKLLNNIPMAKCGDVVITVCYEAHAPLQPRLWLALTNLRPPAAGRLSFVTNGWLALTNLRPPAAGRLSFVTQWINQVVLLRFTADTHYRETAVFWRLRATTNKLYPSKIAYFQR